MDNIKLDNVDPITFLRSFNKLVDYYKSSMSVPTGRVRGLNQMSLQPLTKFPIPKHFEKIQGIYTGTTEKQLEESERAKQKFNQQDEQFLRKHREFMAKTLTRMIDDNKTHIGLLKKSKTFYLLKEARKKNVQSQVRLAKRETPRSRQPNIKKQNDQQHIKQQNFEADYKVLNTQSFKNPKPIIVRKDSQQQQQQLKMRSPEEVEKRLAMGRTRRISQQQRGSQNDLPSQSSNRTNKSPVTKRYSELGIEFDRLFQSPSQIVSGLGPEDIFDPEKYIRRRFNDPTVELKYDYDRNQKESTEKFKKRLAYHYIEDEKLI